MFCLDPCRLLKTRKEGQAKEDHLLLSYREKTCLVLSGESLSAAENPMRESHALPKKALLYDRIPVKSKSFKSPVSLEKRSIFTI